MRRILNKTLPQIREFDGHDWFLTKTYTRTLPHWELKGSTYFITSRVSSEVGRPFKNPEFANVMVHFLSRENQKKYLLHAYVVMPDHFHLILKPIHGYSLAEIMKAIKGGSAYELNKKLERKGKFWQIENFDHLIRNDRDLRETWDYIKDNPVKGKLVKEAENYPFSSFYRGLKPAITSSG